MAASSSQSIEDDLLFDDEVPPESSKKVTGKGAITSKRGHAETKTVKKTAPRTTPSNSKKAKNKITASNAASNIIVETVPEYTTDDIAPIHGSSNGSIFNAIATMTGKYAAMPADSLTWIPVKTYIQFDEKFDTHAFYMMKNALIYIDTSPSPKEVSMKQVINRQPIKSFGQYILIANFNHTDPDTDERTTRPIIFGVNESFVEREPGDYLNIYIVKCNQQTNVYAMIVTTKKKYAAILMQKFIECNKNEWRVLREESSWIDVKNPTRITHKS
jgi:hypothetical protein